MAGNARKPGRPRRSDMDQPTAERILQTAAWAFLRDGYDHVNLADVASQCGVTKATIYYHFANKAGVFAASMKQMMEQALRSTQAILQKPVPLRSRLHDIALARATVQSQMDFEAVVRSAMADLTPAQRAQMHEAEHELERVLAEAIREGITTGEVRELDPTLAARSFTLLVRALHQVEGLRPGTLESRVEAIVSILWDGIRV